MMEESYDFEIVENTRGELDKSSNCDRLVGAVADNFGRIMDIAATIAEIQKMEVQVNGAISMLREKRLMLEQETEAYVKKLNTETDATIKKVELIRRMMCDYYNAGQSKLSGEEFSKIISDVLEHMVDI